MRKSGRGVNGRAQCAELATAATARGVVEAGVGRREVWVEVRVEAK